MENSRGEAGKDGGGGTERGTLTYDCIHVVAAGFWKPLHTVCVGVVKGQTPQQVQRCTTDISLHRPFSGKLLPARGVSTYCKTTD